MPPIIRIVSKPSINGMDYGKPVPMNPNGLNIPKNMTTHENQDAIVAINNIAASSTLAYTQ